MATMQWKKLKNGSPDNERPIFFLVDKKAYTGYYYDGDFIPDDKTISLFSEEDVSHWMYIKLPND